MTFWLIEAGRWGGLFTAALLATIAMEQLLSLSLRAWLLRRDPLVSSLDETASYQRSLFTAASREVRRIWRGLFAAGGLAGLGLLLHPLCFVPAVGLLLLTLKWELDTWECVAVSPWQVAWRRGWRRSIRRLPMVQVARVHLVERELSRRHGWIAQRWGRPLGSCYLALELHNGRAVKLPRTGLIAGRAAVEQAAQFLRRRQRAAQRERRETLREQQRAARRARRLLPDPRERTLQRELAQLRRMPTPEREVYRIGRWPGQVVDMSPDTGPDTLQISAPGDLSGPVYHGERAHG